MVLDNYIEELSKALDYIEENIKEELSVPLVCSYSTYSSWRFQKTFRYFLGVSIGQYIRERRLTLALHLLSESQLRILDVALEFQFASQEVFSRAFKSQFGMSPSVVRTKPYRAFKSIRQRVTAESLQHFWKGVVREPDLLELPELKLVGSTIELQSPLDVETDFSLTLPKHWIQFKNRQHEINHRVTGEHYGVAISLKQNMEEESVDYFSGVRVSTFSEIPEGMKEVSVPKNTYAKFENRGLANKSHQTIDYIYGVWLQNSPYKRARGYDFEIFDHRYSLGKEDSVSCYYLPIENKS